MGKLTLTGLLGLTLILSFISCEKNETEPKESQPEFAAIYIDSISYRTAIYYAGINKTGEIQVSDKGICWDTSENPTKKDSSFSKGKGKGSFNGTIDELSPGTTYYVRAYATGDWGTAYGKQTSFSTIGIDIPELNFIGIEEISGTSIIVQAEITDNNGSDVTERGFYISTTENPDEEDQEILIESEDDTYSYNIEDLEPGTVYSIKAFASNEAGVAYGSVVRFQAKTGNISYVLHKSDTPTEIQQSAYEKIENAMDSALWYYNHYANLTKELNVYYNPNVNTADGNINGNIRFGKEQYMNKVTAMHEMAHTLGVGTSLNWSELMVNGKWIGTHANQVLRNITGNDAAVINGGSIHFWPYGLNYYSEYESKADLVNHVRIVAAMKRDGL